MGTYSVIQELCKKRNTSVRQVEIACGLSHGSISKWDKHKPSYDKAKKVADYFGVDVDSLLYEEMHTSDRSVQISVPKEYYDELQTRMIAQKLKNNPELSVMFEALSDLAPEDAKLVMNMVERMKNGRGT